MRLLSRLRRPRASLDLPEPVPAGVIVPEGFRLVSRYGAVIECDMLREPALDADGCTAWLAVPRRQPPAGDHPDEWGIDEGWMCPPRTCIALQVAFTLQPEP